jgi:hypothetical protein
MPENLRERDTPDTGALFDFLCAFLGIDFRHALRGAFAEFLAS